MKFQRNFNVDSSTPTTQETGEWVIVPRGLPARYHVTASLSLVVYTADSGVSQPVLLANVSEQLDGIVDRDPPDTAATIAAQINTDEPGGTAKTTAGVFRVDENMHIRVAFASADGAALTDGVYAATLKVELNRLAD